MFSEQLPNLVVWALLWGLSWGFFFLYLSKRIDYVKHFIWTGTYFLLVAVITAFVFQDYIVRALSDFTIAPLIVLGFATILHVLLYVFIHKYLQEPKDYFVRYPKRQYLQVDLRRLFSKSMDILSQQVFVLLLIMFLQDAGLTTGQIIITFAVIFGMIHAPLILIERGTWSSWYFTIFSILSAIIFPILIIKIQYGFVYSYIVHWIFYTFTAVGFWIWYNKHREKIY